jgi:hypothetical protein
MNTTAFTAAVLAVAEARGFRPELRNEGGRVVVYLSQPGAAGTFGALYVGAQSGRITGAVLYRGNANVDRPERFRGAQAAGRAIRTAEAVTQ